MKTTLLGEDNAKTLSALLSQVLDFSTVFSSAWCPFLVFVSLPRGWLTVLFFL